MGEPPGADSLAPILVKIPAMTNCGERSSKAPNASTDLGVERTRLVTERTMMAWVRTATSLMTFGFAIQQFYVLVRAKFESML